ncbi:MAG TPA: dihydrodipicolinate synthase family protein [Devosia sp.]|nr:dihydrodipicolinate synthase family protein [Devosia sp.]
MTPLEIFAAGCAIPAHPLALTKDRKLDERRQRAVGRYYVAAGAGGMAVGVHTTQFPIHDNGMYRPVLEIGMEVAREAGRPLAMIAGVQGDVKQAVAEAALARELGYHLVLLRPMAGGDDAMIERTRAVGEILPVVGFYLQPAVGGRVLSRDYWRRFTALDCVAGIKVAPFDRYRTLDVLHGVAESGRANRVALYTGNDNTIISDLISPHELRTSDGTVPLRFVGGLLGQFAVGTKAATQIVADAHRAAAGDGDALRRLMLLDGQLTDMNAALFDTANSFRGCIAGINEVLARQGLLASNWCLEDHEVLSPGQSEEITRVLADYPHLCDDAFIAEHRDRWLSG